MTQEFIYEALPTRVIFGRGKLNSLPDEIDRLGARKALILSTPGQADEAEQVSRLICARSVGVFDNATMHTPVDVSENAVERVKALAAECVIGIGGGSTIGLGKAIALRTGLPQIAIPTTYAGSEMTAILGQTEGGIKTTLKDPVVLPKIVIYDVDLSLTLPASLSGTSGLNAMAHAVEALYAQDRNPVVSLMAEEGIAALGRALPAIARDPDNLTARTDALYGAWLCGICLGSAGMALHHKLCHVLGGSFGLPHSETHAIMLAHTAAYNAQAAAPAMVRVARALDNADAVQGLWDLLQQLDAPHSLKELGMRQEDIPRAVSLALESPYWNPEPLQEERLTTLIHRAWAGQAPQ